MANVKKLYDWGLIPHLRRLYKKTRRRTRGRFDFYDYLEKIHKECASLSLAERASMKMRISEKYLDGDSRAGTTLFLAIIKATASGDIKAHSRWAKALEYARSQRRDVEKMGFGSFAEKNGGIAGMARKVASSQKRKSASSQSAKRNSDEWDD